MSVESAEPEITLPTADDWLAQHRTTRKRVFREFRRSAGKGACLLKIKRTLESGLWEFPVTLRVASIQTWHPRAAVSQYFNALLHVLTSDLIDAGWRVTNSGMVAHQSRDGPIQYTFDISLRPESSVTFYDEDFESDTDPGE